MKKADLILRSTAIFDGTGTPPISGYVAISGNEILAIGPETGEHLMADHTQVLDLGDKLIAPGFTDVHCFFTGYLLTIAGKDFSGCQQAETVIRAAHEYGNGLKPGTALIGRNVKPGLSELTVTRLSEEFPAISVTIFAEDGEYCYMNEKAIETFGFTPDECWSEKCWRLLAYLLQDEEFSVPRFKDYLHMLNSRGITSIKEMGFDDFYGFTKALHKLEKAGELTARVHFMSQPVGQSFNLTHGKQMREQFHSPFLCFSGYNQMTDGSISQMEADMKEPYLNSDTCCNKEINWQQLTQDALAADEEGFRFSLHAQGDGAIAKTIEIYNQCRKDIDGKLVNRHAITDLECSDPADLEQMGKMGILAEIYPQIMSLADKKGKTEMIQEMIGEARGRNYWNRRKMADSGVTISCGTDLPLLYDDIPESIYHAVGGFFPEGGTPFNEDNTLTILELLKAWCYGGQYNLGKEAVLGTLAAGKLADIAVLDGNPLMTAMEDMRKLSVCLTIVDGKIVYQAL